MVKVGDKLEVMTDRYDVPKGTVLTVTNVYDSTWNFFDTDNPTGHGKPPLSFWEFAITRGYLKPLNPGLLPFVPIPKHAIAPTWNIEDLKPWTKINPIPICECGADKHGFASHSSWCGKA